MSDTGIMATSEGEITASADGVLLVGRQGDPCCCNGIECPCDPTAPVVTRTYRGCVADAGGVIRQRGIVLPPHRRIVASGTFRVQSYVDLVDEGFDTNNGVTVAYDRSYTEALLVTGTIDLCITGGGSIPYRFASTMRMEYSYFFKTRIGTANDELEGTLEWNPLSQYPPTFFPIMAGNGRRINPGAMGFATNGGSGVVSVSPGYTALGPVLWVGNEDFNGVNVPGVDGPTQPPPASYCSWSGQYEYTRSNPSPGREDRRAFSNKARGAYNDAPTGGGLLYEEELTRTIATSYTFSNRNGRADYQYRGQAGAVAAWTRELALCTGGGGEGGTGGRPGGQECCGGGPLFP